MHETELPSCKKFQVWETSNREGKERIDIHEKAIKIKESIKSRRGKNQGRSAVVAGERKRRVSPWGRFEKKQVAI